MESTCCGYNYAASICCGYFAAVDVISSSGKAPIMPTACISTVLGAASINVACKHSIINWPWEVPKLE